MGFFNKGLYEYRKIKSLFYWLSAKHNERLKEEQNTLMRLRNFFKTQNMKIVEHPEAKISVQSAKLNAEIKFKQLDLTHLDFEGKLFHAFLT